MFQSQEKWNIALFSYVTIITTITDAPSSWSITRKTSTTLKLTSTRSTSPPPSGIGGQATIATSTRSQGKNGWIHVVPPPPIKQYNKIGSLAFF